MENNKITVLEENNLINFNRVNFDEPSTILDYGQDIIEKIENYVSEITSNIETEKVVNYDFFAKVDELSGFSQKLDDVEEERQKNKKSKNALVNFVRKIVPKKDDSRLSYKQEYQKYVENIDNVVNDVQFMYENSKSDFELFNKFIKSIKPYSATLKQAYDLGVEDSKEFEKVVLELEQKLAENESDIELRREATIKRQTLDIFADKLFSIKKAITAINEIIIQWNMRQVNALRQLTSYQEFLTLDKSILKLNGTALMGAKTQKEEVEMISYLVDGANKALIEGPKQLTEVISAVNNLTKDGNIKTDTFMKVDSYLQHGVDLLRQGAIDKKAHIETSSKQLQLVSQHFDEFNRDVKEQLLLDVVNKSGIQENISYSKKRK